MIISVQLVEFKSLIPEVVAPANIKSIVSLTWLWIIWEVIFGLAFNGYYPLKKLEKRHKVSVRVRQHHDLKTK